MTKTPKRTHPLDRDGDGKPGGSLPGNQTAPMQFASDAVVDPADPRAAAEPATSDDPGAKADTVRGLRITYTQIREMLDAGETHDSILAHHPDLNLGDLLNAIGDQAALAAWQQDRLELMERETDEANAAVTTSEAEGENGTSAGETFTPEEVAAGGDAIDMAAAHDAIDAAFAQDTGPAPTVETVQVAVSVRDLTILVGARRLYKSDAGYSSNYGAPYLSEATVAELLKGGLAEAVPTAGISGGIKATAEARRQLGLKKREEQAA